MMGNKAKPKLYRPVYIAIEWIHDTIRGGEHHQESGTHWVKVKRVIGSDGSVVWVLAESLWQYCEYDKRNIMGYIKGMKPYFDELEWSTKPKYDGYDEDDLMEIRIQKAVKYHHSVPYKQRMQEMEQAKRISNSFSSFPF